MAWLVCVTTLLAPFGVWLSSSCDEACPCDAEAETEHAGHDHHAAERLGDEVRQTDGAEGELAVEASDHGDEDCPDDCLDCRCEAGVMLAVPTMTPPVLARGSAEPIHDPELVDRGVDGANANVFRPPRAHA